MIILENITKIYSTRRGRVHALDGISLQIDKGNFVVIRGPSGSGKTTLLMIIAGMLRPTGGRTVVEQSDLYEISPKERAKFRADNIGFIFQMFHLVPYLNITENIALAGPAAGKKTDKARLAALLDDFGLAERAFHKPSQLSAGEKQRTAIARALHNQPKIILADEPTGNLDPENAHTVLAHLRDFHRQGGTVIVVTHGSEADRYADCIIHLINGRVENLG
ncbi:MAG: ABC transporter ATP-binding protein [Sedimentisphaerales bacterium]|nr:ABC transporter ATP-binding protein [Sedimentisphaerales bacterium]